MLDNDPLWYKDAIIYELHVRAFHDSTADGKGDFRGMTQKLDYLQDLGITTIWLLPFYPSPLRDDGYDIADYTRIHEDFGKLEDFKEFLEEAHRRGLRVITELVINHTSDQHPWFQRARRSPPGSPERDFYVWSDTPEKYGQARIIFKDFETSNWTWDPVAKAWYWHRFYSHQPDLNYDNPAVRDAIFPVIDFWMSMGVDGMRLDAVPYLIEREGTSCENLPETHEVLKALRRYIDERYPNRMLLAEANQWPEDAVAYFGNGDECQMAFHFPVMPRLFMAIHQEDRFPILDTMAQTPPIPDNCQWCMFLRNHDELTLEMVTEEERDYMYRAYATDPRARINVGIRHRLAPLLRNDRRRCELLNGLLFSLPGTPVLYYGDEIGMGDNIYLGDRNGVRTPMQWSADRNAGFSRANPQKLYLPIIIDPEYHYEAVNVEGQQNNPHSLLWWMKRLIALRKRYKAFGRGTLEFLLPRNRKVLVFLRRYQHETILVIANLSRFVQQAELDLSAFQGMVPIEMFGQVAFSRVGKQPYAVTLAPHSFYWLSLEVPSVEETRVQGPLKVEQLPALSLPGTPADWVRRPAVERLQRLLPRHLRRQPWFASRHRKINTVEVKHSFPVRRGDSQAILLLVQAEYGDGPPEQFLLPVARTTETAAAALLESHPGAAIARLDGPEGGILFDAFHDHDFCLSLLEAIRAGRSYPWGEGELVALAFDPTRIETTGTVSTIYRQQENRTSIRYGDRYILKAYRCIEEGINPDLEMRRYLETHTSFRNIASVLGTIEYRCQPGSLVTLAILHQYTPNEGTLWRLTLDDLSRFIERVLAVGPADLPAHLSGSPLKLAEGEVSPRLSELIGRFLDHAHLLGQRAAEMHLALAAPTEVADFAPEPFTTIYRRSLYQSMRNQGRRCFERLREALDGLPEGLRPEARALLGREEVLIRRWSRMLEIRPTFKRTRYHGSFHLAQVLFTGKDFVFINFEGDPNRSLNDRRAKRSPLRDVSAMVHSFQVAAASVLLEGGSVPGIVRAEDRATLEPWLHTWALAVSSRFLRSYFATAAGAVFLPSSESDLEALFGLFQLEQTIAELEGYLADHREWVSVPIRGLLEQLTEE